MFHIKNAEKGPVVWEAHAVRFPIAHKRLATDVCWLIVANNVIDGQVKYFLSNASKGTPVEVLLHVAFKCRAGVSSQKRI